MSSMVPHTVNELPWLPGKISVDQEAPSILPMLSSMLQSLILDGVPSILQSLVLDGVQQKALIHVGILTGLSRQEILSLGLLATQLEPVTRCQRVLTPGPNKPTLLGHLNKCWQGSVAAKCNSSPAHSQRAQDFGQRKTFEQMDIEQLGFQVEVAW